MCCFNESRANKTVSLTPRPSFLSRLPPPTYVITMIVVIITIICKLNRRGERVKGPPPPPPPLPPKSVRAYPGLYLMNAVYARVTRCVRSSGVQPLGNPPSPLPINTTKRPTIERFVETIPCVIENNIFSKNNVSHRYSVREWTWCRQGYREKNKTEQDQCGSRGFCRRAKGSL